MMKGKNILLSGMAVLAMSFVFVACADEDAFTEKDALNNANKVLGINISSNQDWNMTSTITAQIFINIDYGETYTVRVYSNDPLTEAYGKVLTEGVVENGNIWVHQFECATADKRLFVGVTDSQGRTFYRTVPVEDGKLNMVVGNSLYSSARGMRKSMEAPEVPHITIPDDAYAKSFLDGAKEPDDANTVDDHDDSKYIEGTDRTFVVTHQEWVVDYEERWVDGTNWGWGWQGVAGTLASGYGYDWFNYKNSGISDEDYAFWETYCMPYQRQEWSFYGADNQNDATTKLIVDYLRGTGRGGWANVWSEGTSGGYQQVAVGGHNEDRGYWQEGTEGHWEYDNTYVLKFKITGNYNKGINVLASEENAANGTKARTVYISGKWTVASPNNSGEQRVGGGAVIVVDEGGELNIPEGIKMTFVNEARLVVMPGGKVTGAGTIEVTNGNAEGLEGYNGGTIDINTFNNNFGKFYNYGSFKCTNLKGGAGLSNFYNHGIAHIVKSGTAESWGGNYDTPNTRIYNACQWYCEQDMRAYVIEMTAGSYFKVGGELFMSDGNDGTMKNSYVSLAAGALIEVGTLRNNNTSWVGPTSGYAVLQAGGLTYLNWTGNEPITQGYFINNIAVSVDDPTVGAGLAQGTDTYVAMRDFILNGYGSTGNFFDPIGKTPADGNGGAVLVNKGSANMDLEASENFTLGAEGCSPGYSSRPSPRQKVKAAVWSYAFEDSWLADYDMNDVVLKVSYHQVDDYTINMDSLDVTLCCTGAAYDLTVHLDDQKLFGGLEVHRVLKGMPGVFINTGSGSSDKFDTKPAVTTRIPTPSGFMFKDADFWIKSPEKEVHIAKVGDEPHGVIIPEDWRWPKEWTCIKDAYPLFVNFATDVTNPEYADWYKTYVEDKLY